MLAVIGGGRLDHFDAISYPYGLYWHKLAFHLVDHNLLATILKCSIHRFKYYFHRLVARSRLVLQEPNQL